MSFLIFIFLVVGTFLVVNKAIDLLAFAFRVRARHYELRTKLLEEYDDIAGQFLHRTENINVPTLRSSIASMPLVICDKKFAFRVLFQNSGAEQKVSEKQKQRVRSEVGRLSTAQENLLAQAIGTGLIASTYTLPVLGMVMRRAIYSGVDRKSHRIASPQQTVITIDYGKSSVERRILA